MRNRIASIGQYRWSLPLAETVLVALVVGSLLWMVQAEQATLPLAAKWADARIAAGEAEPAQREQLERAYRTAYSWQDTSGRLRTYPVSRDSFYFLRLARNIVETGTPCPGSAPGEPCHDTQVIPPQGRAMGSAYSPHPWAIALVYKTLQVTGSQPSMLGAGVLHNRLMLVVCAVLAYWLLRRVMPTAPRTAGLAAAIVLLFLPAVMVRSFGVDNDVWNLALLLAGALATARYLPPAVEGQWRPLAAACAGVSTGLLAACWGGWLFLLVMIALVTAMVLAEVVRRGEAVVHRLGVVAGTTALAGAVFAVLAALLVPDFLSFKVVAEPVLDIPPPNAFATVTELRPTTLAHLQVMFGWPVLGAAMVGLGVALYRLRPRAGALFPETLLLLLVWTAGATLYASRTERFLILLAPPLAILAGLALGALPGLLPRPVLRKAGTGVLALTLAGTVTAHALELVRDNFPQLDTAWVAVLNELSRTTPDDTVLISWWDTGHWVTYWSRRATAVDGASLRDPRIHTVGRLLAADPAQPLGRLANEAACGSESDCGHPLYLLTSDHLLQQQGWMISGFWQPERAKLVDDLNGGVTPSGVNAPLLAEAMAVRGDLARSLFAAPDARLWSRQWASCTVTPDNSYDCPLNVISGNGWQIRRFVVPAGRTQDAHLIVRHPQSGKSAAIFPTVLRLATPEGLLDVAYDSPTNNPGVLLDTVGHRAFLGSPAMLHSLVARLVLLEGRYDGGAFTPVATASTVDGHRVTAWRITR